MRQFYYKIRQLLQNAMILLQNATVITNCESTHNKDVNDIMLVFLLLILNIS